MPGMPRTLPTSCGSATIAVVPCGTTTFASSRRHQQRALDMHVAIDQARHEEATGDVDRFPRFPRIRSDAGDPAVGNDDVARLDAAGEDVDHLPALEEQIARLLPQRHADSPLQDRQVHETRINGWRSCIHALAPRWKIGTGVAPDYTSAANSRTARSMPAFYDPAH